MNAYEVFASVYDELMDNIPYDDWCAYIIQVLQKYRVIDGLVCELGCGTGEVTERLADAGYDMIGIDNSYDMLEPYLHKSYSGFHNRSVCSVRTEVQYHFLMMKRCQTDRRTDRCLWILCQTFPSMPPSPSSYPSFF